MISVAYFYFSNCHLLFSQVTSTRVITNNLLAYNMSVSKYVVYSDIQHFPYYDTPYLCNVNFYG